MSSSSKKQWDKRRSKPSSDPEVAEFQSLDKEDLELLFGPMPDEIPYEPPENRGAMYYMHQTVVEKALNGDQRAITVAYKYLSLHLSQQKVLPEPYRFYFSFVTNRLVRSKDKKVLIGKQPRKKPGPKEQKYKKMLITQLVMYYQQVEEMAIYAEAIPKLAMQISISESSVKQVYEQYKDYIKEGSLCLYHSSLNRLSTKSKSQRRLYVQYLIKKIQEDTVTFYDVFPKN